METSVWMIINHVIQLVFLALGVYYFVISLFSFIPRKEDNEEPNEHHTFALLVAAHNEQAVIENMVESLNTLNYPRDKYEIFVIADNCTDATAQIARNAGAQVFERVNADLRGKGYALEWMFNNIYEMDREFDYVAVFDADNVVDSNFLLEMNKKTQAGNKVIQGYIDSKNPTDSWITYSYSIAFWTMNKLYQQGRANLGWGCQLCGTGFVVNTGVLKQIGWGATCLTEDMEFTMKLALNDMKVSWAYDAKVYDEKPITFSQSWKQRVRWMQGGTDVASRFVLPLAKKAVREGDIVPLDCAIYLLQPLRIVTLGAITVMAWLNAAYPEHNLVVWGALPSYLWNAFVLLQFAWGPMVLWTEKKFTKRTIFGYIGYMLYTITWVPIAVVGMAKKNQKEWFHTQHTRTISIREVN